jgi:hypothetical protein
MGETCIPIQTGKQAPFADSFSTRKAATTSGLAGQQAVTDRAHRGAHAGVVEALGEPDGGVLGEFNWSSQHLDCEELGWQQAGVGQLIGRDASGCVPLGVRR